MSVFACEFVLCVSVLPCVAPYYVQFYTTMFGFSKEFCSTGNEKGISQKIVK